MLVSDGLVEHQIMIGDDDVSVSLLWFASWDSVMEGRGKDSLDTYSCVSY